VRQIEVGNELAAPGEQAAILAPRQRASDERGLASTVHGCRSLSQRFHTIYGVPTLTGLLYVDILIS